MAAGNSDKLFFSSVLGCTAGNPVSKKMRMTEGCDLATLVAWLRPKEVVLHFAFKQARSFKQASKKHWTNSKGFGRQAVRRYCILSSKPQGHSVPNIYYSRSSCLQASSSPLAPTVVLEDWGRTKSVSSELTSSSEHVERKTHRQKAASQSGQNHT